MRLTFILVVILAVPAIAFSATLKVPSQFGTIQAAINTAAPGDTVLVAAGTYVENIDFKGKAITVMSEDGPDSTVIDGNQAGSVVTFKSYEGYDSVLDGFGITNGSGTLYTSYGYCGGGIFCQFSSPTLQNNAIYGNTVKASGGGMLIVNDSSPNVINNVIYENAAEGGPYSGNGGGGIGIGFNCSPLIMGNRVHDNSTNNGGGGIALQDDSTEVINNRIYNNKAFIGGGIATLNNSFASISSNIINDNLATSWGGGLCSWDDCKLDIINNTLYNNTAVTSGGGMYCRGAKTVVNVINTIFWGDSATMGSEIHLAVDSTLEISYSDVTDGHQSVLVDQGCKCYWGAGMIDSDPLFVDPVNGDFHLTYPSPCKDTGDNSAVTEPTDFEGDGRCCYGTVDMGADEFYTHLYWTGDATPGGAVDVKLIGLPGSSPVGLFLGFGVFDPPLKSMWGDWYLKFPFIGPVMLAPIPSDGVEVLPGVLPGTPSGPYSVYMQAIIEDMLTNLCILEVK